MALSFLATDNPAELADILKQDVPWESYMTARLITDRDLQLIRRYDKRSEELRASMLDESGAAYAEAFLSVLKNVTKESTVQYVLALLLQMLIESPARARLFHQPSDVHLASPQDPYTVFLRLLQRQDWFTQEKAAKLLATIVQSRPRKQSAFSNGVLASDPTASALAAVFGGTDAAEPHISSFVDWLCGQLKRPSHASKSVPTATSALATLLQERGSRQLFLRANGIQLLGPLLKSSNTPTSSQLLYELCLCAWQMTYIKAAAEQMGPAGVLKSLVEVCRLAQKEKVFRMALGSLRNLLGYEELALAADMVEAGLLKIVTTRQLQTWGDEDIVDSLNFMEEKLKEGVQQVSNFEKYRKELLSSCLDWSPMHTSELFWRENAALFEDKDFQLLRVLLKLIESSREVRTLAVACSDLAQFITYNAQGRYIVSDLRGKDLVMRLMTHPDPEVQKQALLCVQKIMLSKDKLEFLQASK